MTNRSLGQRSTAAGSRRFVVQQRSFAADRVNVNRAQITDQLAARGWSSRERTTSGQRPVIAALIEAGWATPGCGLAWKQPNAAGRGRLSQRQGKQLETSRTRLVTCPAPHAASGR
ncbi:hypothetical protein AMIS_25020 [Actinoplanes missouriensis 431]|uniref:Uncharacterized protein n=1 Tax=Actinoplanes missouriensis (strain ATCC 14538 / DSM 43046 / CBS 188.64 / JCM 3121 / NBRC 102363 / NCIMB 12654 / NRRL B-3342 / UNCC 431) TaxID=512565 RepID=I0H3Y5_ACTM4|nr:hypothetical protein AMIS_25020 [Actinoplanes missouriensis 431]